MTNRTRGVVFPYRTRGVVFLLQLDGPLLDGVVQQVRQATFLGADPRHPSKRTLLVKVGGRDDDLPLLAVEDALGGYSL